MKWSMITECGPVRLRNEDWVCACPELGFFAVADGMGGHRAGNVASKLALDTITEYIRNKTNNKEQINWRDFLRESIMHANKAVYLAASEKEELRGMGSTINACQISGSKLLIANVGDSRALLLRGSNVSKLTNDHSLVQELVDGGGITAEEAFNHPRRNVLTRALGIGLRVEVDIFEYNIQQGDKLLICTDGLSGFVTEQKIGELMEASSEPDTVANLLLKEAIASGSNDNISMIIMVVE